MPNSTAETTAHGSPGGLVWVPARSLARSVEVSITPITVITPPTIAAGPGRSPSTTTASVTPTTAYVAPIGETTATGPSCSAR